VGERPIMVHFDSIEYTKERELSSKYIERKIEKSLVVEILGPL